MTKEIFCSKLKKTALALDNAPFPGPLGERILKEVSKEAWENWKNQQTIIINEYRLSLIDAKAREFLRTEMEKYFFTPDTTENS
jgi:Fe-S cluster biosynthesis and repair protein YggX